ncbi:MAG: TonB-dependent receptor [Tannerellaceae bacterium]|nr:TonB-dependent receptor [Tannerellaceae bacterium]
MRDRFIIICIFFLTVAGAVFSQNQLTISGVVREKSSKEVIANATINISGDVSVSGERGFFSVKTSAGQSDITVSYVGFKPFHTVIDAVRDTMLVIELEEGIELKEVVVEHRRPTLQSKGLGNIRLDLKQLYKTPLFLGERDVIKAMQFLPGVSSGMEGSSSLNIRGGTNDQTLYLMDNVPIYNQNHTFGLLSIFNPEALHTVDLYKGGIPAMYGNRLSGVANVSFKDGNMKEHNQSLSVGLLSGSIHLEGPIVKDKLSYMLSARRSLPDLITKGIITISNHSTGMEMFAFYDINAKTTWNISNKTNLSLLFYNGYDDLFGMNKDYTADDRKYSDKYGYGWKSMMTSLRLTSALSSGMYLYANLYYTNLNNFKYFQQKSTSADDRASLENYIFSNLEEFGLKTKIEHKISNNNTLFYGMDLSRQYFKPDYMEKTVNESKVTYDTDRLNLQTLGLFVFDEFTLDDWLLGIGLRSSAYRSRNKTLFTVEPRIKISKFIGDRNKIMLAYDYTTQPVHSLHEMTYTVRCDFWVPFQEDKLPAAQQYSIGWKNYPTPNLTVSAEAYLKEMKNLLRIDNLEYYIDYHDSYAVGKGRSYGLELMAQYDSGKLSTWLSYTLSKSTRTFNGSKYPFKYDSPNDISAFVGYDVYKKNERTNTLSLNMQYRTGIPYSIPSVDLPGIGLPSYENGYDVYSGSSSLNYIPKSPNTRLPDYFRLDINFTMERKLKNRGSAMWQFSLLNATGHVNPYAVYRGDDGRYKVFLLIPFMPSLSYKREF